MKMSIAVLGSPYASQSAHTALNFTKAALIAGHDVIRVFFYHEAAYVGNGFNTPPQDEFALTQQWSDFAIEHDLELIVCVASALRRGILDKTEAKRYDKQGNNMAAGFQIGGLGQLIDAGLSSDRLVTFSA
ncbi:MAG: sulfurtransferase complex subunit TusD [Pseudomonadales bacterium]|jgi:tRNA 2-thiouridine synthesizing protein D|tara:strand:- start:35138 stop:35530 length:393 start_codon:yes stop_codon:yes gene_type:complete